LKNKKLVGPIRFDSIRFDSSQTHCTYIDYIHTYTYQHCVLNTHLVIKCNEVHPIAKCRCTIACTIIEFSPGYRLVLLADHSFPHPTMTTRLMQRPVPLPLWRSLVPMQRSPSIALRTSQSYIRIPAHSTFPIARFHSVTKWRSTERRDPPPPSSVTSSSSSQSSTTSAASDAEGKRNSNDGDKNSGGTSWSTRIGVAFFLSTAAVALYLGQWQVKRRAWKKESVTPHTQADAHLCCCFHCSIDSCSHHLNGWYMLCMFSALLNVVQRH
jgi:hypothetical protein